MTDEKALLKRAKAYDEEALTELYNRYAPKIYAYIYRRVSNAALAEDLTGELFFRVLRSIQNENAWRDSFRGWIYRIAHNLVVDHYRRRPAEPPLTLEEELVARGDNPAETVEDMLDQERLLVALRRLTPAQQQVLTLRFGEGFTARETAQIMEKTTGAVEALQHRAIASLQRILTKDKES